MKHRLLKFLSDAEAKHEHPNLLTFALQNNVPPSDVVDLIEGLEGDGFISEHEGRITASGLAELRKTHPAPLLLLEVTKISVLRTHNTDAICMGLSLPTTFPELERARMGEKYLPVAKIETRKGYAEEWLKLIGVDLEEVEFIATAG